MDNVHCTMYIKIWFQRMQNVNLRIFRLAYKYDVWCCMKCFNNWTIGHGNIQVQSRNWAFVGFGVGSQQLIMHIAQLQYLYQAQNTCIRHIIIILCIVHTCIVHNYLDHIGFSEWLANSWSCRIPHWKREQVNTAGKYFHSHRILMITLSNDVIQIRKEMVSGLQNLIG